MRSLRRPIDPIEAGGGASSLRIRLEVAVRRRGRAGRCGGLAYSRTLPWQSRSRFRSHWAFAVDEAVAVRVLAEMAIGALHPRSAWMSIIWTARPGLVPGIDG